MLEKVPIKQAYADYELEQQFRQLEAQNYYMLVVDHFNHKIDAVYEDTIIDIIGKRGLALIREFHLMESCGSINGRKLYTI